MVIQAKHTRDGNKEGHRHTPGGDIIYDKDNYSEKEKRKLTAAEVEQKMNPS